MGRTPNSVESVTLTFTTSAQVKSFLEILVKDGTWGKNINETAERVIAEKIRELKGDKILCTQMQEQDAEHLASADDTVLIKKSELATIKTILSQHNVD